MTTNGTLLNEEINNFIIQNKIGTMISIDGNKKQHNANRFDKMGNGSYDEVMDKTDALRKMGYLSARATITATNINLVYCIVDIWLNIYSYYSRFMLK